jgi:hypothetical protein
VNIPEGYIGLCSYCILNLIAASTPRVGSKNKGLAKDMEGEILQLSGGRRFEWKPGNFIPAGAPYLSDIVLLLGEGVDIETYSGSLWPYAVTMNDGTLVCEQHNGEHFHMNRTRRR